MGNMDAINSVGSFTVTVTVVSQEFRSLTKMLVCPMENPVALEVVWPSPHR